MNHQSKDLLQVLAAAVASKMTNPSCSLASFVLGTDGEEIFESETHNHP